MESVLKEEKKRAARAKYILVHFIPSVQDNGQKSSNERSRSEQRTDRVEIFPVTFSMPLPRLTLLR